MSDIPSGIANLPDEYCVTCVSDGVWNGNENRFRMLDEHRTRWILGCEFSCSGFVRIMAFLMPGMFKKQTGLFMLRFKEFAEAA